MRVSRVFLHTFTFLFFAVAVEASVCGPLLSKEENFTATENFKTYASELLSEGFIQYGELVALANSTTEVVNPIEFARSRTSIAAMIHYETLADLISENNLDVRAIADWAKQKLAEVSIVRSERESIKNRTKPIYKPISFATLASGSFEINGGQIVRLNRSIEVLSTPVTQKMWVELMGENPSYFAEGENSVIFQVAGKSVVLQADHPVERVTWFAALEFANRLSIQHGFKPVYDLGAVVASFGTRAENGSLFDESDPLIPINAPSGDIYRAEGFRLPTDAEQEFLLRARGTSTGPFYFGDSSAVLEEHAWHFANSKQTTHPVGLLSPLLLDGKPVFDLLGNVWEWSHDDSYSGHIPGRGFNPVGYSTLADRGMRGGAWDSPSNNLYHYYSKRTGDVPRSNTVGFRLVRTLPTKSEAYVKKIKNFVTGFWRGLRD